MQLNVRDIARVFHVDEKLVYRWINDNDLPTEVVNGQYRFNPSEVMEWATFNKKEISPLFFQRQNGSGGVGLPRLDEALQAGGIHYNVAGADKQAVLRSVVELMRIDDDAEREMLLQFMLSREASASTAIGNGIAIPHPRYPAILSVPNAFITLCFLAQPVSYSASGQQVHTLFALVSPTVRTHLGMLARLSCALQDKVMSELIAKRAPAEDILRHVGRLEDELAAAKNGNCEGHDK